MADTFVRRTKTIEFVFYLADHYDRLRGHSPQSFKMGPQLTLHIIHKSKLLVDKASCSVASELAGNPAGVQSNSSWHDWHRPGFAICATHEPELMIPKILPTHAPGGRYLSEGRMIRAGNLGDSVRCEDGALTRPNRYA